MGACGARKSRIFPIWKYGPAVWSCVGTPYCRGVASGRNFYNPYTDNEPQSDNAAERSTKQLQQKVPRTAIARWVVAANRVRASVDPQRGRSGRGGSLCTGRRRLETDQQPYEEVSARSVRRLPEVVGPVVVFAVGGLWGDTRLPNRGGGLLSVAGRLACAARCPTKIGRNPVSSGPPESQRFKGNR